MTDPRTRPSPEAPEDERTDPLLIAVIVLGAVLLLGVLFVALRGGDEGDVVVLDDELEEPTDDPADDPDAPADPEDGQDPPATAEPDADPDAGEDADAEDDPFAEPTPDATPPDDELPLGPGTAVEAEDSEPSLEVQGEGDARSDVFEHGGGLVIVRYTQEGEDAGEVSVRAVPEGDDGEETELLAASDGQRGERAGSLPAGTYRLEISGSAPWRVTLDRPRYTEGAPLPLTVEGNGDTVSDPFEAAGEVRLELTSHDGGELEVRVLDVEGEEVASFSSAGGTETVELDEGLHLLDIVAEGRWTIIVS